MQSPPSPPSPAAGRDYEDLVGGAGKEVYFRPRRYRPEEFGQVRSQIDLVFDGKGYRCDLHDVSQNGVAFVWPAELTAPTTGAILPSLTISFDDHQAYRGSVQVGSVRDLDGASVVGASFIDSLVDIDDALHIRQVSQWSQAHSVEMQPGRRPWFTPGHEDFKSLVLELKLFFEDANERLAKLEAELPWNVIYGDLDSPARQALIAQLRADFMPVFIDYSERINAACSNVTQEEWKALKEISQRMLNEWLMQAPFMKRAFSKPLGYPGDFEVMRFLYERHFEGTSLFAKAMHHAVVMTRAGDAVRDRKDMLKSRFAAQLNAPGAASRGRPTRIASIAAGPALEIFEALQELREPPPPVEIVLFDQDRTALSFAQGRISRVLSRLPTVKMIYLHDSIRRLLNDPQIFSGLGPFDTLFCSGLFDYLRFPTAVKLVNNFYSNLAPGGTAYVGNMALDYPGRWFLEQHLEWYLLYRSRDEMLEFARAGAPAAECGIIEERSGLNPFVTLRRT